MELKEIIKNLEHYNNWRRDNDNKYTMPDTKLVGITIDKAISELNKLLVCGVGSSLVEYEKSVSMDAITLKDITEDNIVVGRYLLDEGKLYKIDLVEKYTLIDLK